MGHQLQNLRPPQARLISAIAESGQLQLAAQHCNMTQPAASRMLAGLESQLGMVLFERTPKGMEPTPSGHLLAQHAARLVHDLDRLAEEFNELKTGRGGIVRVGSVTGPAIGHLVPAIQRLKSEAPSLDISVEIAPSSTLVHMLERGDLDFALARLPPHMDRRDFAIEPARDEIVNLLVRDGHPLLGRGPQSLATLHGFPWILQDQGAPIRHAIETAFSDESLSRPDNIIATSSLLMIIALLPQSDALAPMAREITELMLKSPVSANFRTLELNRPITVDPYLILRSRGRIIPKSAERLLGYVRELIRQHPPTETQA